MHEGDEKDFQRIRIPWRFHFLNRPPRKFDRQHGWDFDRAIDECPARTEPGAAGLASTPSLLQIRAQSTAFHEPGLRRHQTLDRAAQGRCVMDIIKCKTSAAKLACLQDLTVADGRACDGRLFISIGTEAQRVASPATVGQGNRLIPASGLCGLGAQTMVDLILQGGALEFHFFDFAVGNR